MILPSSQIVGLIMLVIGMLCWGSWTSLYKMTSKWRWELFYFDVALGAGIAAIIAGFTLGTMGWDGFSFIDDMRLAGRRQDLFAFLAGLVFNLGNMMIIGALSVAGVTVASMVGLGLTLTVGMLISYLTAPSGNAVMLVTGAVTIVVAAAFVAVSSRLVSLARFHELMREGKTKTTRKVVSVKGLILAAVGGLIAGAYSPLLDLARSGENGLGPYSLGFFFAAGLGVSTFVFNLFFMNLPVQGEALEIGAYFKGKPKFHYLGVLAGVLLYVGILANLVSFRLEGPAVVSPLIIRSLSLGAIVIGALWGIIRWKEFAGAEGKAKAYVSVAFALYAAGIFMLGYSAASSTTG